MLTKLANKFKRSKSTQDQNENVQEKDDCAILKSDIRFDIKRRAFSYKSFVNEYAVQSFSTFSLLAALSLFIRKNLKPGSECMKTTLVKRAPVLKWLRHYSIKENLLSDILSGITVAIVHIPQSMAYALLATVAPIYGLYTSFFPPLIYCIFGTSRQISIGTFAVISLMVAGTLSDLEAKYVPPIDFNFTQYKYNQDHNIPNAINAENFLSMNREQARVMIMTSNTFWVGAIQLSLFFLNFGFITSYLSESFLNGFLCGSAVHVFTSQMKFIFGIKLTAYSGIAKIPKTYIDLFSKIDQTNLAVLVISIICVIILFIVKYQINERFKTKMPFPFPIELLVVIFGTLISYLVDLNKKFKVSIVDTIPAGIPGPEIPPFFLIKDMFVQCFITALVSFTINFSLADMFAKAHKYKINSTQEFLAYGSSNLFGSFFLCFANGGSLARSIVQNNSGGKTQLVSIVSCTILGFVLLYIAPLFEKLPQACLASIIVVALKPLLLKVLDLKYYWSVNRAEFLQFLVTVSGVVFLDVEIGLAVGIAFYGASNLFRSTMVYYSKLGNIPGTELYKDISLYRDAIEINNTSIVRFQHDLHSTNSVFFKKAIYNLTSIKPHDRMTLIKKVEKYKRKLANDTSKVTICTKIRNLISGKRNVEQKIYSIDTKNVTVNFENNEPNVKFDIENTEKQNIEPPNNQNLDESYLTEYERDVREEMARNIDTESRLDYIQSANDLANNNEKKKVDPKSELPELSIDTLIIDFSPINFIDSVGIKTIYQIIKDYNEIGIHVYLADMNDLVRDRFKKMENACKKDEKISIDSITFISIHDAVLYTVKKRELKQT